MLTKIIVMILIRRHLGLKRGERFQFNNQKSTVDRYYFSDIALMKEGLDDDMQYFRYPSNVKLNYILSKYCKITKCEKLSRC